MNTKKITEFEERYQNMHEEELVDIHENQNSLVEEAKIALAKVISERKIDLIKLAREVHEEKEHRIKKREIIKEKEQKRDAFFYKIMLVIGIPVCLFQLLFNPDKFIQTFFSTIGFAFVLAIVLGIAHLCKKAFKNK